MSAETTYRLQKACRELQVGLDTAVRFLAGQGYDFPCDPNCKISHKAFQILSNEFNSNPVNDLMTRTRLAVQNEDYATASELMKEIKQHKTGDLKDVR